MPSLDLLFHDFGGSGVRGYKNFSRDNPTLATYFTDDDQRFILPIRGAVHTRTEANYRRAGRCQQRWLKNVGTGSTGVSSDANTRLSKGKKRDS